MSLERDKATDWLPHSPVVHLVRRWETFCGPVEETVAKDKPGKTRPHPHDHLEGHTCIVDQLRGTERGRKRVVKFFKLLAFKVAFIDVFFTLSPIKVIMVNLFTHPAGTEQQ